MIKRTKMVNVVAQSGGVTPTGTINISENNTYDVTNYASAVVNVPETDLTQTLGLLSTMEDKFDVYNPELMVSANPDDNVTYTALSNLNGYTTSELNALAKKISNASTITYQTETIYLSTGYSISVGCTRNFNMDNVAKEYGIIGFNFDTLTSSTAYGEATTSGKAGITWQMTSIPTDMPYVMNDTQTTEGGWAACKFRNTYLPTVLAMFDADDSAVFKQVEKICIKDGNAMADTELHNVTDTLFIISASEFMSDAVLNSNIASGWYSAQLGGSQNMITYNDEGNNYAYYNDVNNLSSLKNSTSTTNRLVTRTPSVAAASGSAAGRWLQIAGGFSAVKSQDAYYHLICFCI